MLDVYTTELVDCNRTALIKEDTLDYDDCKCLNNPDSIVKMMNECFNLKKKAEEYLYMIAFDTNFNVIGVFELSHGTANASITSPREVYLRALLCGAVQIILVHNHPSGNDRASREDKELTKRVAEAGKILNVSLVDHVIVAGDNVHSMKREGEM